MKNKYKIKRDGGWEGEEEGLKIFNVGWDATDEEYRFVCDSWIYNFIKSGMRLGKTVKAGGVFFYFLVQVQSSQTFGYSGQI